MTLWCSKVWRWCHFCTMAHNNNNDRLHDFNYPLCQLASQFSTNWVDDEDLFWAKVPNFNWNLLSFEYKTRNTKCCIANWWGNQYCWPCKKVWKHSETFFQVWAITSGLLIEIQGPISILACISQPLEIVKNWTSHFSKATSHCRPWPPSTCGWMLS